MKSRSHAFAFVALLGSLLTASATTEGPEPLTQGDYAYTTNAAGQATIMGFSTDYTGALTITNILGGHPVVGIGERAFIRCSGLTGVTIPDGVTKIGDSAFMYCSNLTSLVLSGSVIRIGDSTFNRCGGLADVTIPDNVKDIGQSAFLYCDGLTTITIGSGVGIIYEYAFYGCRNLQGAYFKGNAPELGIQAFKRATRATVYHLRDSADWDQEFGERPTVVWDPKAPFACSTNQGSITISKYASPERKVTIPDMINGLPVTAIGRSAFQNCSHVTRVAIPDSVTRIGASTFRDCSRLTDVTLPSKLTTIERGTFQGCTSLSNIVFSGSVTKIEDGAFNGCEKLVGITLPASVASIGANAFMNCGNLAAITVAPGASARLCSEDGVLFSKDKATLVCYPAGKKGSYAMPDSVSRIMSRAFFKCVWLVQIKLSARLADIGPSAFQDCSTLMNITFPESLTAVGDAAFFNCNGLVCVALPANLTRLGFNPFSNCSRLTAVTVDDDNPSYNGSPDGVVFSKDKTSLICCPAGKAGSYTVPATVTNIAPCAFQGCFGLTTLTLPAQVSTIGDRAFQQCSNLKDLYFQGSAPRLGRSVFQTKGENPTVYYLPGVTGWSKVFGGRPADVWKQ